MDLYGFFCQRANRRDRMGRLEHARQVVNADGLVLSGDAGGATTPDIADAICQCQVGVVGCGGRGLYMSGLSPDLNYVALAEPDMSRESSAARDTRTSFQSTNSSRRAVMARAVVLGVPFSRSTR